MRLGGKRILKWQRLKIGGLILFCVVMSSFATASPPTQQITIHTFFPHYSPKYVQVVMGTPISWKNPTKTHHSITHDECTTGQGCAFDSGPIGPNQTFFIDHLAPGYYPYHCSFHPVMRGVLVVRDFAPSRES